MATSNAANAETFAAKLKQLEGLPGQLVLAAHRKLALDAWAGVTEMTPVATGRARASWTANVGGPAEGGQQPPGSYGAPDSGRITAAISRLQPFVVLYISNNLPYASRLEHGWSKQAPTGMVANTLARLGLGYSGAPEPAL